MDSPRPFPAPASRRLDIEIIRDVLRAVRDERLRTRVMYRANLSHEMLCRYLALLHQNRLVVPQDDGRGLEVTALGHEFLAALERTLKFMGPEEPAPPRAVHPRFNEEFVAPRPRGVLLRPRGRGSR